MEDHQERLCLDRKQNNPAFKIKKNIIPELFIINNINRISEIVIK